VVIGFLVWIDCVD